MSEVYLLRHSKKDSNGDLTQYGQQMAVRLGKKLPKFTQVISSGSPRARHTAALIAGVEPIIDERAGYYETTQEKSDAIAKLATDMKVTFLEAAYLYDEGLLRDGINRQADGLNQLVDETLSELACESTALIVSHDMTITPAMLSRGEPKFPISNLSGYRINGEGFVSRFENDMN